MLSLLLAALLAVPRTTPAEPTMAVLLRQAPRIDPKVLAAALNAVDCAGSTGSSNRSALLTAIDYSRPSTEPRLWVFDLERRVLLFEELVAHGQKTGDNLAAHFSNKPGSLMSSLGLFRTGATYQGRNGYSLRLQGLEPGINDRSLERAIVVHGAPYVSAGTALRLGRLGRSWGCPAVRREIARPLIDVIKDGSFLFIYYPDQGWLGSSRFLRCGRPQ